MRVTKIFSRKTAILILSLSVWIAAPARTRDLSVEEGRQLVIQALEPAQRKLRGLEARMPKRTQIPEFYKFEVQWDNPTPGSVVVGSFAVNRVTGDVWELAFCERKKSQELARLQESLRKKIGLSAEELKRLTEKAPCQEP
jgi:hypothetical protein